MELIAYIILFFIFLSAIDLTVSKPYKSNPNAEYDYTPVTYYHGVANQFMSAEHKREYLQSERWQILRRRALLYADHKCEICGNTANLEAHHVTYKRLGKEDIADVRIVCRHCHQHIHDTLGYDRRTNYSIEPFQINYWKTQDLQD